MRHHYYGYSYEQKTLSLSFGVHSLYLFDNFILEFYDISFYGEPVKGRYIDDAQILDAG